VELEAPPDPVDIAEPATPVDTVLATLDPPLPPDCELSGALPASDGPLTSLPPQPTINTSTTAPPATLMASSITRVLSRFHLVRDTSHGVGPAFRVMKRLYVRSRDCIRAAYGGVKTFVIVANPGTTSACVHLSPSPREFPPYFRENETPD
jgi:hypothetical protein